MKGRRVIETPEDFARLQAFLGDFPMPYTLTVAQGKGRTLSQNALLHMWFGEIAKQRGDSTMTDVKGECHRKYGLAIRLRDEKFAFVWRRASLGLDYGQQCALLASGILNVSSEMNVAELKEYMNAMGPDYRAQGFRLTDPELLKYQDTAA